MTTIRLYFRYHPPVLYTGEPEAATLQIANARLHSSYVSWDEMPKRGPIPRQTARFLTGRIERLCRRGVAFWDAVRQVVASYLI